MPEEHQGQWGRAQVGGWPPQWCFGVRGHVRRLAACLADVRVPPLSLHLFYSILVITIGHGSEQGASHTAKHPQSTMHAPPHNNCPLMSAPGGRPFKRTALYWRRFVDSVAKRSLARMAGMHVDEALLLQMGPDERQLLSKVRVLGRGEAVLRVYGQAGWHGGWACGERGRCCCCSWCRCCCNCCRCFSKVV